MDTSITWKKSGIPVSKTINRNRSFQSSLSIDLDDNTNDTNDSNMSYSFHSSNEKKPSSRVTQMVSKFNDNKVDTAINKVVVSPQHVTKTVSQKYLESSEESECYRNLH
jgi:hypothetical protein